MDQELLQDAVRRYGLAEEKLSHLDESKPSLFERFDAETRHYITILQTTLLEFAEVDNVVLMGRGGQWLLRGIPHVLRVRLIAPFEHRVRQWIKRRSELTGETPTSAPPPTSCVATTPRRRDGCATSTRWTSTIPPSTTSSSTPRSSATTPRWR